MKKSHIANYYSPRLIILDVTVVQILNLNYNHVKKLWNWGSRRQWIIKISFTYNVPLVIAVCIVWFWSNSLDRPKSVIFGSIFASSNMLAGFRSKWIIGSLECSWRYCNPYEIPSIILQRVCQLSPEDASAFVIKQRALYRCIFKRWIYSCYALYIEVHRDYIACSLFSFTRTMIKPRKPQSKKRWKAEKQEWFLF
jgi:uncharacterized membrane protein YkvI